MSVYTFYFLNADGSVPAFEFDECAHDGEARKRALERLRRHPERRAVEVRLGQELVFHSMTAGQA
jgi:hypothetical protein